MITKKIFGYSLIACLLIGCNIKEQKDMNDSNESNNSNLNHSVSVIENNSSKSKDDDLINTILSNNINNLDQLEKAVDKVLFVIGELGDMNNSILSSTKIYETKSEEYEKKIGVLLDTIYKLHNKNLELSNEESNTTSTTKDNIDKKFDDLLQKYNKILKESSKYKINSNNYKKRLDELLLEQKKAKIEKNAAKNMFDEIEIKGE